MRLTWLWLRRLADERTASLGLALLVFATALAAGLGPRLLERMSDEALQSELAAASSFERNTVIYETARPRALPLTELSDLREAGERLEGALPAEVRRLVHERSRLVETSIWHVIEGTDVNSLLRLRVHEGALERVRLVEGRLPTGTVLVEPDERPNAPPNQRAWVYEAILPASALDEMGAAVGDRLWLTVWLSDPLNLGQNVGAFVQVVGSYELADAGDEFWIRDEAVGGWRLNIVPPDITFIQSTALLSPEAYRPLIANTQGVGLTILYQWRFYADASRLTAERLDETITDYRRLEGAVPRSGISDVPSDTTLSSGMLRLLLQHAARWRSAEATLAVVGLGLAAIALATLGVVAAASSVGRRRVASLLAARGASSGQLVRNATVEATILALPVALLAGAAALILIPTGSVGQALGAALWVWLAATAILLVLAVLAGRNAVSEPGRGSRVTRRLSPRRLVGETAVVVAAVAGAWLLRERGVSGASSAIELTGADPIIAAVPALVGVAAGLLAMRIYPLPSRLLAALLAHRRDLLPVLAVRRIVRGGSSAPVLLLLVATATLGAFAAATLAHLERAADLGAWQRLGAEYRITSTSLALPATFDESELPGVEASARASLRSIGTSRGTSWLLAVDLPAYRDVIAGTPAAADIPAELLSGEPADGVPVIASTALGLRAGDAITLNAGREIQGRVVDVRGGFPGLPPGDAFVLAANEQLATVLDGRPPQAGLVYVRAAPQQSAALRAALAEAAPGLELENRTEVAAATRAAPVMGALSALIGAGVLLAIGYAALAVAASLALAAAAQRQQLAHLRALGLSRRGALWLTFIEYGPAALLGYLAGVALGLGLFAFLRPGLGLAAVSGPVADVPIGIEPTQLAALLAAVVAILVVGWLLAALVQRNSDPADLMRRGIE